MKGTIAVMKILFIAIIFMTNPARAEIPESCQELSSTVFKTISDYFLNSPKVLVSVNVPMFSICVSGRPMPAYNFDCVNCNIPFSVRYIESDGTCYDTNMAIMYEKYFNNLQVAEFAMMPTKCLAK